MKIREHTVGLQGTGVLLRPMTEDDWDILLKWNNDPDVLYFAEGDDIVSRTMEEVKRIYSGVSRNAYCSIIEAGDTPIGECWLQKMNLERIINKYPGKDCRRIDLVIGEKELWGKGIGTDVIGILTGFGFEVEQADLIFGCDVADYNPRSMRAFKRNGYRVDARIKQPAGKKARFCYDLAISREQFEEKKGA